MTKEINKTDPFEILDKAAEFPASAIPFQKVADWFDILAGKEGLGIMSSRTRLLQIIAGLIMIIWESEEQRERAMENKSASA